MSDKFILFERERGREKERDRKRDGVKEEEAVYSMFISGAAWADFDFLGVTGESLFLPRPPPAKVRSLHYAAALLI